MRYIIYILSTMFLLRTLNYVSDMSTRTPLLWEHAVEVQQICGWTAILLLASHILYITYKTLSFIGRRS